jgi:hypothetical protein
MPQRSKDWVAQFPAAVSGFVLPPSSRSRIECGKSPRWRTSAIKWRYTVAHEESSGVPVDPSGVHILVPAGANSIDRGSRVMAS